MTEFLNKSFSVHMGSGQEYRDNWDRIFKKKEVATPNSRVAEVPDELTEAFNRGYLAAIESGNCCGRTDQVTDSSGQVCERCMKVLGEAGPGCKYCTADNASEAAPGGCGCVCRECLRYGMKTHTVCIYICGLKTRAAVPADSSSQEKEETTESGRLLNMECGCAFDQGCICYTRR